MKKRNKSTQAVCIPIQNPVAKFAAQFNKAATFRDHSKYTRNSKHKKQEAWSMVFIKAIDQASCFYTTQQPA